MVVVGQKVKFDPFAHITFQGIADLRDENVTGTVVYVNYEHRWFSVEYGENPTQRTSFNFSDIGKAVAVLG